MAIITHDSASQRVSVEPTDRTYHGRQLAIVHDLDERGERTDTGYIVALTPPCTAIDDQDREIVFRDVVSDDLSRGEWLANWGGQSDTYDEPERWIRHHADLGDACEIVERFAELLRRHWPGTDGAEIAAAKSVARAIECDRECGQYRIERIGDAVRWLAASLPMLDASVGPDGRVTLFARS